MSRYFVLPEEGIGPGGDIYFRHYADERTWYRVFIGDKEIGFVVNNTSSHWSFGWTAWSYNFKRNLRKVEGFKTRLQAGFYLVKHQGYWLGDEKELTEAHLKMDKDERKRQLKKVLDDEFKGTLTAREAVGAIQKIMNWEPQGKSITLQGGTGEIEKECTESKPEEQLQPASSGR